MLRRPPFHLTLLALSATKFARAGGLQAGGLRDAAGSRGAVAGEKGASPQAKQAAAAHRDFRSGYQLGQGSPVVLMSKAEERRVREEEAARAGAAAAAGRGGAASGEAGGVALEDWSEWAWEGGGEEELCGGDEEAGGAEPHDVGPCFPSPRELGARSPSGETGANEAQEAGSAEAAEAAASADWGCDACTFLNPPGRQSCEMCGTRRGGSPQAHGQESPAHAERGGASGARRPGKRDRGHSDHEGVPPPRQLTLRHFLV